MERITGEHKTYQVLVTLVWPGPRKNLLATSETITRLHMELVITTTVETLPLEDTQCPGVLLANPSSIGQTVPFLSAVRMMNKSRPFLMVQRCKQS